MIRNYIKIAWRNLLRYRVFSLVNVLGLVLGIASSLLILLWVQDEWNTDRFHAKGDRLYRVMANTNQAGVEATNYYTPGPLAEALKETYPAIVQASRMPSDDMVFLVTADNKTFKEKGRYVGGDFFTMFSFPLLYGKPETALKSLDGVVISASLARKYFDTEQAVGKLLRINEKTDYQVSAVMADMNPHSSFRFELALPTEAFENRFSWTKTWDNNFFVTYVELAADADPEQVTATIKDIVNNHTRHDENSDHQLRTDLFLQPYADQYLHSEFTNGQPAGGRIEYVRLFLLVVLFTLLIACVNFMNLSTARSFSRAKEVGLRKIAGAPRRSLIVQFMVEAFLLVGIAALASLLLVHLLLPAFNQWTEKQLALTGIDVRFWSLFLGIVVATGLIAGSYPALFLSGLQPTKALRGTLRIGTATKLARRGLVIFQFSLSVLFLAGALVVARQLHFIKTKKLGFDRHNLILIPTEGLSGQYREELLRYPSIESTTWLGRNPIEVKYQTSNVNWEGKLPGSEIKVTGLWVDYDFLATMKIKLKLGRYFSPRFTDSSNYVINETAARMMGFEDPLGKELEFWPGRGHIIGVISDFHMNSLHEPIIPLIMALNNRWGGELMVRTTAGQTSQALQVLEKVTKKYNRQYPFEFHFLDETFERQYRSETLTGQLINCISAITIIISCLGLFGLATFTAAQRTKEIGIRKVLGASVSGIVRLLSSDFVKPVLMAILIASPIAWWAMNKWLDHFAYRIEIQWWMLGLAGLLAVVIALLTVSFQSFKAALMNPVKSLRSE